MECDLKLTKLLALTSPYLAKFMKHNKSNTVFLQEIIIICSPVYLSKVTYVRSLSSFNLMTELRELIPDAIIIP